MIDLERLAKLHEECVAFAPEEWVVHGRTVCALRVEPGPYGVPHSTDTFFAQFQDVHRGLTHAQTEQLAMLTAALRNALPELLRLARLGQTYAMESAHAAIRVGDRKPDHNKIGGDLYYARDKALEEVRTAKGGKE